MLIWQQLKEYLKNYCWKTLEGTLINVYKDVNMTCVNKVKYE